MKILPEKEYHQITHNSIQSFIPHNLIFNEILQNEEYGAWFEASSDFTNNRNEFSYLAVNPDFVIERNSKEKSIKIIYPKENLKTSIYCENYFSFLSEIAHWQNGIFQELKLAQNEYSRFPFVCGFFGYFGYDLKNEIEKLEIKNENKIFPDSVLCFYPEILAYEYSTNTFHIFSLEKVGKNPIRKILKIALSKKYSRKETVSPKRKDEMEEIFKNYEMSLDKKNYENAFEKIKTTIVKGKIYQACLTAKFQKAYEGDPLEDFCNLRNNFLTPFTSYFRFANNHILSFSVESFLKIRENKIFSKPVKGTIIRKNKQDDLNLRNLLQQDEKEKSENFIIVDLIRNDIGKIAKIGTVKVLNLLKVETYPTVHQLVSEISGILPCDKNFADVLKSMFPGGSMTGAPKIETMKLIDEVETCARGIYSGAIGFLDIRGHIELSMTIRSAFVNENTISFHSGGGIVYDSQLEKEWDELIGKSEFFLRYFCGN